MYNTILVNLMLLLTLTVATSCHGQMDINHHLNSPSFSNPYFANFEAPNPSIAYMVIKDGEIVLQKTTGYADVENQVLATPQTNYRIASISKMFTSAAIMKLIHEEKLGYETTLSDIFPEFPVYGDFITVEHLLLHRSGILEYYQFFEEGKQMTDEKVLESLMSINTINSQPNEKFDYRNSGYAVLAQIVEKISGQEFEDYMQNEIFIPAGMPNTTLYLEGMPIKSRAYGYTIENDDVRKTDQSQGTAVKGDGCIYTSLEDFYHWDQALYGDGIIPQETLEKAFFGYDEKGRTGKKGYGYGWEVNYDENGVKMVGHTGASLGFTHHYVRVPDKNISVVLFTNRNHNYFADVVFNNMAYGLLNHFSDGEVHAPIK